MSINLQGKKNGMNPPFDLGAVLASALGFGGASLGLAGASLRSCLAMGARRTLRLSHSLSSLRKEPAAQVILLQRSPSRLEPNSQTSGQTRAGLSLIESSASTLANLTSSLVLAC